MDVSHVGNTRLSQQASPLRTSFKDQQKEASHPKDKVVLGDDSQSDPAVKPHKKWLFFSYIAGDCNLTKFQCGNIDQQELAGSDENTHIAAFIDVGPKDAPIKLGPDPGKWSGAKTFYINKDTEMGRLNPEIVAEHGDHVDMSNPDVMAKALIDAIKKFPADHIAVIFNDHGGGFTGAMSDDSDGGSATMPQIKSALKKVKDETGRTIDIVGFDACLMGELEVGYEIKDYAKIMLASEENEGGPGWTYDSMLGGKTLTQAISTLQLNLNQKKGIDVTPREFAKIVVDVNRQHNEVIPTFSAVCLKDLNYVKEAVNDLAQAVIDTKDKQKVKDAIGKTENYGGGWAPYRDIRDLHHLCTNLETIEDPALKNAAEKVRKAVEKAVFANENNPKSHPNSHGISIYAPTQGNLSYDYKELDFSKDTKWDEALESLGVKFSKDGEKPTVWPDGSKRKNN